MPERDAAITIGTLINNAAKEIKVGQYVAAHRFLVSALANSKKWVKRGQASRNNYASRSVHPDMDERYKLRWDEICSFNNDADISSLRSSYCRRSGNGVVRRQHGSTGSANDDCFLFQSPLKVNLRALEMAESHTANLLSVLTLAAVYNLALTEHLHTLDTAVDPNILKRSLALYRYAARMLVLHEPIRVRFFKIVISNNMGHAYNCLECPRLARDCFQELANAISFYSATSRSNSGGPERHLHSGFLRNALLLFLESTTAAAA